MASYLVTGAAGFIGRSIAAALLARGETVRGIDNFITGKRSNLAGLEAMEFIEGDLADPAVCAKACAGRGDCLSRGGAGLGSALRGRSGGHQRNCVDATLNLLVAARDAGVRRVVYAGSSSAYGDSPTLPKHEDMLPNPISPYAVAKLAGEHYMSAFTRVYGLETVTLRYFNVFGPYQDPTSHYSGVLAIFCRKMLAGEQPTIYGDGEQSRDFTYIENVVHANLLAAAAPAEKVSGRVMNAATGMRITLNETFSYSLELTGYSGKPAYAPPRAGDIRDSLADIRLAGNCWATAQRRFPRRPAAHRRVVPGRRRRRVAGFMARRIAGCFHILFAYGKNLLTNCFPVKHNGGDFLICGFSSGSRRLGSLSEIGSFPSFASSVRHIRDGAHGVGPALRDWLRYALDELSRKPADQTHSFEAIHPALLGVVHLIARLR